MKNKYIITGMITLMVLAVIYALTAGSRKRDYLGAEQAVPPDLDVNEHGLAIIDYRQRNEVRSRGWRNNNPGNLVLTKELWAQKVPNNENTDGKFEQFNKVEYGVRALMKLLTNYILNGRNSIHAIISRYSTTDRTTYMNYVAAQTGIGIADKLQADKETITALAKAICEYENLPEERHMISDLILNRGWQLI